MVTEMAVRLEVLKNIIIENQTFIPELPLGYV